MKHDHYKGVMVYIEQRRGEIQKVSMELLGKGRELADKLGEKLSAVIIGDGISNLAQELIWHGAEEVYVVDHPTLAHYMNEPYTKALVHVIEAKKPDIILVGATALGRDLAPRVSARIHTGLTADCTSLDIDEETQDLLMTRPAFGGNIMATIICPDFRPQMSTVRPGVMKKPHRNESLKGSIEHLDAKLTTEDMNVVILEAVIEDKKRINIEDAVTLVSAGRGIGSKEGVESLSTLADLLKAEVSGSRAVIDLGWLDKDRQVGQTGKTVRPNLYFACGISGAIQHVAGMEESECIIAINKNPDAPIFEVADLGIVGDVHKVISALVDEIVTLRNEA
jgi:electron transfer flavoprotein alpha subunit